MHHKGFRNAAFFQQIKQEQVRAKNEEDGEAGNKIYGSRVSRSSKERYVAVRSLTDGDYEGNIRKMKTLKSFDE